MTTIIEKPWGKEEVLEKNELYMVKRLTMNGGRRCSVQYHEKKCETVYVLSGLLRVLKGPSEKALEAVDLGPGEFITIEPFVVHRMEALETSVYLESSPPLLEDVVRVSDDYGREGK